MLWRRGGARSARQWVSAYKVLFMVMVLLGSMAGSVHGAQIEWTRAEDGLPTSTNDPTLFRFGHDAYLFVDGELYVQLYNQPCFGWSKVTVPAGTYGVVSVGDYLFATSTDLWWLEQGNSVSLSNWNQVTSSGLPSGANLYPWAIFDGNLYGVVHYVQSGATQSTFDIYRTPDIGNSNMTWSKVVAEGFGDPQNHALGWLGVFQNKLVAITTATHDGLFGDVLNYLDGIEVWESATGASGSWTQVNTDGFGTTVTGGGLPSPVNANCNLGAVAEYDGRLYVGTKSHLGAEIWRYDGTGLSGWSDVTPVSLGIYFGSGPGRVERMVEYDNWLYVAEGFPTANLMRTDGISWSTVESGPNPFDAANSGLLGLAVHAGATVGEKLFVQTHVFGGGYQLWSYPFTTTQVTCSALNAAIITVAPNSATNELGSPGQTHTVTATLTTVGGGNFADVVVTGRVEVAQNKGLLSAYGFFESDGTLAFTYPAVQGPQGLGTDTISVCYYPTGAVKCDNATKTWVDTTPPQITINVPQNGATYALNAMVMASFVVTDAVGVDTVTATVPDGAAVATGQAGIKQFTVSATDFGPNTATESISYVVAHAPMANAGPDQMAEVGVPVTFDGTGCADPDGVIVTWKWDFGDGTQGTGATPTHTYTTPGTKTVTLTVTDSDGLTATDTVEVTVEAGAEEPMHLLCPFIIAEK